ncbi:hypothetical protein ELI43_04165 [Rhizobium leguminosarum]|nr:hypothetical protein ELI43_04165 [Rhizobium leguminosarum]
MPNAAWRLREPERHIPFSPHAGRRCRQADEGPVSAISRAEMSPGIEPPARVSNAVERLKPSRINAMHLVRIY